LDIDNPFNSLYALRRVVIACLLLEVAQQTD